jgi:two-component SAPR family response regulator
LSTDNPEVENKDALLNSSLKKQMITILLAGAGKDALSELASGFKAFPEIKLSRVDSCKKAFQLISEKSVDLVIVDETIDDLSGIGFAEKLVSVSPMTHCSVVSPLSENDFQEATEGLGVLMQLPPRPDKNQAKRVVEHLTTVLNLIDRQ